MSTKQKRKAKPRAPRKEKQKPARKRKVAEEKKKEAVPAKKVDKVVAELPEKPLLLAIRLIGPFGAPTTMKDALTSLRLSRKFRAVLVEKSDSMLGALRRVKDYVTWGEVKSHVIAVMLKERGELSNGMALTDKFVKENVGYESIEDVALARRGVPLCTSADAVSRNTSVVPVRARILHGAGLLIQLPESERAVVIVHSLQGH